MACSRAGGGWAIKLGGYWWLLGIVVGCSKMCKKMMKGCCGMTFVQSQLRGSQQMPKALY